MRALLVGTPGRAPFVGHFRGRATCGAVDLRWAGRVRSGSTPDEGWIAAEAARDALVGVSGGDRFAIVDAAWTALRNIEHADLSVLFVASDADGIVVAGCGLVEVRADGLCVAPAGHPLYDEPGIRDRPGYFHPEVKGEVWVAVPLGGQWPAGAVEPACGEWVAT